SDTSNGGWCCPDSRRKQPSDEPAHTRHRECSDKYRSWVHPPEKRSKRWAGCRQRADCCCQRSRWHLDSRHIHSDCVRPWETCCCCTKVSRCWGPPGRSDMESSAGCPRTVD